MMQQCDDNEYDGDFPILDCEPRGVLSNFEEGSPLQCIGDIRDSPKSILGHTCMMHVLVPQDNEGVWDVVMMIIMMMVMRMVIRITIVMMMMIMITKCLFLRIMKVSGTL